MSYPWRQWYYCYVWIHYFLQKFISFSIMKEDIQLPSRTQHLICGVVVEWFGIVRFVSGISIALQKDGIQWNKWLWWTGQWFIIKFKATRDIGQLNCMVVSWQRLTRVWDSVVLPLIEFNFIWILSLLRSQVEGRNNKRMWYLIVSKLDKMFYSFQVVSCNSTHKEYLLVEGPPRACRQEAKNIYKLTLALGWHWASLRSWPY